MHARCASAGSRRRRGWHRSPWERRRESVPRRAQLAARVTDDRRPNELPMLAQHLGVPDAQVIEEPGGPLDIAEEERNRRFGHGHRGPILRIGDVGGNPTASQPVRAVSMMRVCRDCPCASRAAEPGDATGSPGCGSAREPSCPAGQRPLPSRDRRAPRDDRAHSRAPGAAGGRGRPTRGQAARATARRWRRSDSGAGRWFRATRGTAATPRADTRARGPDGASLRRRVFAEANEQGDPTLAAVRQLGRVASSCARWSAPAAGV